MELLIVLSTFLVSVLGDCSPDGVKCCLTEFLPFVSPNGIQLTEQKVSAACTIRDDTHKCLSDFADQCVSPANEELEQSINRTKVFLSDICRPESEFKTNVKLFEDCFQNASMSFIQCYNRTLQPAVVLSDDESKWKAECCDYKELRNCAVQSVENVCGQTASQVLQDEVMKVNGAALELACKNVFGTCNSAVTLASSAFMLLIVFCMNSLSRFL
ncbi:uncharacterized protein [Parasteatoda tepidariorum]|uniref:uncharacterized protein n=1 Tax=Parasteatoda tepidariorum TaxID=114398 RepID=UPI00077FE07D|nr:uncharacterized protein LOC107457093 [Parasteatoda tepidariorum]